MGSHDLDPRRLMVLSVVAQTGGISAAAAVLNVTASAVSQQVTRLEREAGTSLLLRDSRRIELTEIGKELAEHGLVITEEQQAAASKVAGLSGALVGSITVSGCPTVVRRCLVPVVATINSQHPELKVSIVDSPDEIGRMSQELTVDVMVIEQDGLPVAPAGTADLLLLDDPYLLVMSDRVPVPDGDDWLSEVLAMDWISGPAGTPVRDALDKMAADLGSRVRVVHEMEVYASVLAMAGAGLGVALIPRLAVPSPAQRAGARVRAVNLPELGSSRLVARYRRSRGGPGSTVRAVLDALAARCAALTAALSN